jgi:hypothetical protein
MLTRCRLAASPWAGLSHDREHVLGHLLAAAEGHVSALGQRRSLRIADDVDALVGLALEARQLHRGPAFAQAGLADQRRRAHRQDQVGVVERHIAKRGSRRLLPMSTLLMSTLGR